MESRWIESSTFVSLTSVMLFLFLSLLFVSFAPLLSFASEFMSMSVSSLVSALPPLEGAEGVEGARSGLPLFLPLLLTAPSEVDGTAMMLSAVSVCAASVCATNGTNIDADTDRRGMDAADNGPERDAEEPDRDTRSSRDEEEDRAGRDVLGAAEVGGREEGRQGEDWRD